MRFFHNISWLLASALALDYAHPRLHGCGWRGGSRRKTKGAFGCSAVNRRIKAEAKTKLRRQY